MAAQNNSSAPVANGSESEFHALSDTSMLRVVKAGESILKEEIAKHFDIKSLSASTKSIRIVDVGCAYGETTVQAVHNIMDAIKSKYKSQGIVENQVPEFEVFFNDLESNDFNAVFRYLPANRDYFAAALPGSFYNPILSKQSLHVVHSSNSLNWLSEVPKAVTDSSSPAYNKGKIHIANAPKAVTEAYAAQYAKDLDTFLNARTQDVAVGGLLALHIPSVPEIHLITETFTCADFLIFESCLLDMVKEGLIGEEQVDSFNLGFYFTCPKELKEIIEKNGKFSIKTMAKLEGLNTSAVPIEKRGSMLRAYLGDIFKRHFGTDHELMNELFDRYSKKVLSSPVHLKPETHKMIITFTLLKRNHP